ncbi:centromere protein Q [Syngnathus scovelli]|uniref:centromere protein Q n=1 Tax=Syngnathus scovelli TaxID=161590 RepID=UPI002110416C|nr:centromere protein Q [Syngnathus scovelli]
MKPLRSSHREPSKIPTLKNKSKKKTRPAADHQDSPPAADNNDKSKHQNPPKDGKASETAPKVKSSIILKPMPRSSINALENMLNLAIMTTLGLRLTEKEESQKHLNIVKNKFLSHCAELQVPVQKHETLGQAWPRHREESRKCQAQKQTLTPLEEDLKAVVSALESTEEQASSLQRVCSSLREQLEEEEKAKEMLQRSKQAVVRLPSRPPRNDETTLEAELMRE